MNQAGERENSSVIPSFNKTIRIDFRGAKISSDAGVLMLREIDERFNITAPLGDRLDDPRRASHLRHTYVDLTRQRVYQMAAGYEDCNDANHLRIDSALRLALGKDEDYAASQSMLSRLENEILGNEKGMAALDETLQRSIDSLLRNKSKGRLILDMDSTEDPPTEDRKGWPTTVTSGKAVTIPCSASPPKENVLARNSGMETYILPRVLLRC